MYAKVLAVKMSITSSGLDLDYILLDCHFQLPRSGYLRYREDHEESYLRCLYDGNVSTK